MVQYSDKASAVTVFSREYGRLSLIVYGTSGRKSGNKAAFLQPLSLVDLSLHMQPGKEMQVVKELRIDINLAGISAHPVKNAIALFLAEFFFKTLRIQQEDVALYDFIQYSLEWLNEAESGIADFHLVLMCRLTRYLGFEPNTLLKGAPWFDMMNGCFCTSQPLHTHCVKPGLVGDFTRLLECTYASMDQLQLSRQLRNDLLDTLLEYYRLHIPEFHTLQSVDVLHELFS